jgi:hypothetical protein
MMRQKATAALPMSSARQTRPVNKKKEKKKERYRDSVVMDSLAHVL